MLFYIYIYIMCVRVHIHTERIYLFKCKSVLFVTRLLIVYKLSLTTGSSSGRADSSQRIRAGDRGVCEDGRLQRLRVRERNSVGWRSGFFSGPPVLTVLFPSCRPVLQVRVQRLRLLRHAEVRRQPAALVRQAGARGGGGSEGPARRRR